MKSALLSLAKNGIIVLNNGYDEAIPKDLVTAHSIIDFLPALHEFGLAFKKGYFADSWMGSGSEAVGASTSANSTTHSSDTTNNNGKRTLGSSSSDGASGTNQNINQRNKNDHYDQDRAAPTLRVSNRVRRAVLNPHEPVLLEGSIAIL